MSGYERPTDQPHYNTVSAEQRRLWQSRGKRSVGFGIVSLTLGLIVTIATYSAANTPSGGVYIVAWGPMLYGVISVIRGISLLNKSKSY